jgi:drug/metabolite transporter (DMT)-like permease
VALFGWWLFDESLDRWTVIGAGIILASNAYIAHREAMLARRAATQSPTAAAKPGE